MQDYKLLKISWITMTVMIAVGMFIALANVIKPLHFLLQDSFEVYIGQSWSILVEQQPKHAAMYELLSRECSWYYFVLCFHALFIVLASYRKAEKWAWVVLMLGHTCTSGALTIFGFMYFGVSGTWIAIVCLFVGLIALLLPVKEIWGAKAGQTA